MFEERMKEQEVGWIGWIFKELREKVIKKNPSYENFKELKVLLKILMKICTVWST